MHSNTWRFTTRTSGLAIAALCLGACSSIGSTQSSPTDSSSSKSDSADLSGAIPIATELPGAFRSSYQPLLNGAANNPPQSGLSSNPPDCTLQGELDKSILAAGAADKAGFTATAVDASGDTLAEGVSTLTGSVLSGTRVDIEADAQKATGRCREMTIGTSQWRTERIKAPSSANASVVLTALRTSPSPGAGVAPSRTYICWAKVNDRTILVKLSTRSTDRTAFDQAVEAAIGAAAR